MCEPTLEDPLTAGVVAPYRSLLHRGLPHRPIELHAATPLPLQRCADHSEASPSPRRVTFHVRRKSRNTRHPTRCALHSVNQHVPDLPFTSSHLITPSITGFHASAAITSSASYSTVSHRSTRSLRCLPSPVNGFPFRLLFAVLCLVLNVFLSTSLFSSSDSSSSTGGHMAVSYSHRICTLPRREPRATAVTVTEEDGLVSSKCFSSANLTDLPRRIRGLQEEGIQVSACEYLDRYNVRCAKLTVLVNARDASVGADQ